MGIVEEKTKSKHIDIRETQNNRGVLKRIEESSLRAVVSLEERCNAGVSG